MPEKNKMPLMTVLGVMFTLIALVALATLVRIKSSADVTQQTVSAVNTEPSVDSIIPSMTEDGDDISLPDPGFVLQEDTTKTLFVRGTVIDPNGCSDLVWVTVTAYRSGVSGGRDCSPDRNDCYTTNVPAVSLLNCSGGGDTSADFKVQLPISYYADPTDAGSPHEADTWQVAAVAEDDGALSSDPLATSMELQSLAAFGLSDDALDYGTVSLGGYSDEKEMVFHNSGNRTVDSYLSSDGDMSRVGLGGYSPIPSGNVHYSLILGFDWTDSGEATPIGIGEDNKTDMLLDLAQETDDGTVVTTSTYFKLKMPTSGVSGSYSNVLTFMAHVRAAEVTYETPANPLHGDPMGITNVHLGLIDNDTALPTGVTDAYHDYTSDQATHPADTTLGIPDLAQGSEQSISIDLNSDYYQKTSAWIDFNHDGTFSPSEKIVDNFSNYGYASPRTITVAFDVPAGASLGQTRMRIGSDYDSYPTVDSPVGPLNYGEFEDYTVNIVVAP